MLIIKYEIFLLGNTIYKYYLRKMKKTYNRTTSSMVALRIPNTLLKKINKNHDKSKLSRHKFIIAQLENANRSM